MFPFRRRKKMEQRRDPLPGWAKWAALAFIIYAVAMNPNRGKVTEQTATAKSPTPDVIGTASEKISEYKNVLSKFGVALRVEDLTPGSGHPIICGQEITLGYEAFAEDGKQLGDSNKAYAFRIGEGKAMPAIEQGVVGMAIGGKRSIFARNTLAYGSTRPEISKDSTLRFDVEMLSAAPDLSKLDSAPFRIADTDFGNGGVVVCGKPVSLMATVWSVEGKKLFETKEPLSFTPGKSEIALGIEQGIIGMNRGGARTLIIPPQMQKPMHGGKPAQSLSLPQPQAVIVDVAVN